MEQDQYDQEQCSSIHYWNKGNNNLNNQEIHKRKKKQIQILYKLDQSSLFNKKLTGKNKKIIYTNGTDKKKLQETKHKNNYQRINVARKDYFISLLKENPSATTVSLSKLINLSRTKVSQLRKQYQITGNITLTENGNSKSLERIQRENCQKRAIKMLVQENPRIGLKELVQLLYQRYQIKLGRSCIHKRLTQELGYKFSQIRSFTQKPILNDEQTILSRGNFCKRLQDYKLQQIYVCGTDTIVINSKNSYAWIRQGQKRTEFLENIYKDNLAAFEIKIILTINAQKLIRYDFYHGQLSQEILHHHIFNGYSSQNVSTERRNLIIFSDQVLQKLFRNNQDPTFIQDIKIKLEDSEQTMKIQAHKSKLQDFIQQHKINHLVFPRFSKSIDPCYHFFQLIKRKFKLYIYLKRNLRSQEKLKAGLVEVINLVSKENYQYFFRKISFYLNIKEIKVSHFIEKSEQNQQK